MENRWKEQHYAIKRTFFEESMIMGIHIENPPVAKST